MDQENAQPENPSFVERLRAREASATSVELPEGAVSTRSVLALLCGYDANGGHEDEADNYLRPNLEDYTSITGLLDKLQLPHDEAHFDASIANAKKYLAEMLPWTQEIVIPEDVLTMDDEQKIAFTEGFMAKAEETYGKSQVLPELTEELKAQSESTPAKVVPLITENTDREGMSRRQAIMAIGVLGLAAACKKEYVDRTVPAGPYEVDRYVKAGRTAVFYAPVTDDATKAQLETFDKVVVQPGFVEAGTLKNAVGYGSSISLVDAPGLHTSDLFNYCASLKDSAGNEVGFLKDATGARLKDPVAGNDPMPYMINIMDQRVYDRVKAYLVDIGTRYPQGAFIDSLDSIIEIENRDFVNPAHPDVGDPLRYVTDDTTLTGWKRFNNRYAGLTDRGLQLINEVAQEVKNASGHNLIVAGGINNSLAAAKGKEPIIDNLLKSGCQFSIEALYKRSGELQSQEGIDWIKGRLKILAEHGAPYRNAADPASRRDHMELFSIDPVNVRNADGSYRTPTAADYRNTTETIGKIYGPFLKSLHASTGFPLVTTLFTGAVITNPNSPAQGYFDFGSRSDSTAAKAAIANNAALRGQEASMGLVKAEPSRTGRRGFLQNLFSSPNANQQETGASIA